MKKLFAFFLVVGLAACQPESTDTSDPQGGVDLGQKAEDLAQRFILTDTHIDLPYRLEENFEDISQRTEMGDFDYPRAKAGGLNLPFMAIYIPADHQETGDAKEVADRLIDRVEGFAADWPDKFAIATSVADVHSQFAEGKMSLAMGMENGAPIAGDLENLQYFYDRGIRYITLTHGKANHLSDSSYDPERKWNGLSEFGKEVVVGMNLLGMMVDISHVSDEAFYQVIESSLAPVIASHSSCRAFTPGWERNMDDAMIQALARNGGVIQINFGSSFLNDEIRQAENKLWAFVEENNIQTSTQEGLAAARKFREEEGIPYADITDVVDHIDHVVKLVGVDYVGLGSDFDGLGDTLPTGLKDVSDYPNLIHELLKRGYSEEDIEKICAGNFLRVWSEVERMAQELQSQ